MQLCDYVRSSGRLSYDGNGVGMFSRNAYIESEMELLKLYRTGNFDEFEDTIFSQDGERYRCIEKMPGEFNFLKKNTDDLKQIHYDDVKKYDGYPNGPSAYSFYSNTRTAISTCSFGLMYPARIKFPYLDYELFSFVASLRPEQVAGNEPQAAAVRKSFPDVADIPFYNEIELEQRLENRKLLKMINVFDLAFDLARFNFSSFMSLIDGKFINRVSGADYGLFANMLLCLSMIKYCSRQRNASAMLDWTKKNDR